MTEAATPSDQPDRKQLREIIGGLTDGVILIEPDRRIVWANEAALDMHGCASLDELGMTPSAYRDRFTLSYRDGREIADDVYPMDRLCAGETFDNLIFNVCRRGKLQPDWVHRERGIILEDGQGYPDCLVLVIGDWTEAYEAEQRFESMFNANPAPALIARLADLRFVRVNEGFLELSGYREDEIIGRTIYELDILARAEHATEAKTMFQNGDTIPQMEAELPLPGDRTKLVLLAGHPAEMANERCMIFTFADLEPRRRAEEALRQSEERFATAFRLAPVPMLLSSLDGHHILNANHAFLRITGWSHEAVIGRRPADLELWETGATRREIERRITESGSFQGTSSSSKHGTGSWSPAWYLPKP